MFFFLTINTDFDVEACMGNIVALVVMYINERLNCIIASQIVTAHHMGRSVWTKVVSEAIAKTCCSFLKTTLQWRPAGKTVCRLPAIQFYILTCTKLVPLFTSGDFVLAKAARHALSRKWLCICVSRESNELVFHQMKGEVNAIAVFPVHTF